MYLESPCSPPAASQLALLASLPRSSSGKTKLHRVWRTTPVQAKTWQSRCNGARAPIACLFLSLDGRYLLASSKHEIVLAPNSLHIMGTEALTRLKEAHAGSCMLAWILSDEEHRLGYERLPAKDGVIAVNADSATRSILADAIAAFADSSGMPPAEEQLVLVKRWLRRALHAWNPGCLAPHKSERSERKQASGETAAFEMAKELMQGNLAKRILIEDVAAQVGLSSRHLARVFKAAAGSSPGQWLNEYRLERAKAMLESGEESCVKAIAYGCGFSNPSYFAHCYKRRFGVTPSAHHKWKS